MKIIVTSESVTIPRKLAEHLVNALLLEGYAERNVEHLAPFVDAMGDTSELVAVGRAAMEQLRGKRFGDQ